MRILVLGGTRFAGRAIVEAALGRGDTVTLFNRGITNPGLFPGVETVIGDRTEDLHSLGRREFDAVVDVAGYDPATVRMSAETLKGRVGRYVFVSTVSVYASQATTEAQLEDAPLAELKPDVKDPLENYGANKALCEAAIREAYGERALIGRPGLISGPHDPTDRFPYWPRRIARGGRALAPGDAGDLTQVIDVRDLAAFLLDAIHRGRGGVYNLTGAPRPFGILLDLCRTATYSDAELTWIPTERLLAAGVDSVGIPLWIGEPGYEAFNDVDSSRAVAAGLGYRAITETIRDTLAWDLSRGGPEKEGFDPAEEARLLEEMAGLAVDEELGAVQDQSFARASAATAKAYPPERRLTTEQLARYLDRRSYAVVSSARANGRPHAAPSLFYRRGSEFWLPTVAGSARERNVRAHPWLALTVTEGDDDEHLAVLIEGPAEAVPPEAAPAEFLDRPGDWARVWLVLRAERIFSYAEPGVPLD